MKNNSIKKSRNGLVLSPGDVVITTSGVEYLALIENKKLVCQCYDKGEGRIKRLMSWNGSEIIYRGPLTCERLSKLMPNSIFYNALIRISPDQI